jgi:hypothetical protein
MPSSCPAWGEGKSGYAPACATEWKPEICQSRRVKYSDCPNQAILPVDGDAITRHLSGGIVAGAYPLDAGDTCWFLAVDFDEGGWPDDARAFIDSCRGFGVPAAQGIAQVPLPCACRSTTKLEKPAAPA